MNEQKVYVNPMWFEEKTFNDGGSILKVNIQAEDLIKFLKANKNKDGYVKIVISKRKQVGDKGQTHYAYLDTWQPTTNFKNTPTKEKTKAALDQDPTDSLI